MKTEQKHLAGELRELYSLYKIEHESLWACYDENKDYGHIFALSNLFEDKFKKILEKYC